MEGEDFRNDYDYDKEKDIIGRGSYGSVYKVTKKDTKEIRAIKVIDINQYKKDYENQLGHLPSQEQLEKYINLSMNEINLMKIVQGENNENENTVRCFGYYYKKEKEIAIVMEFCDGNLANMMSSKNQIFTLSEIREILSQLNNTFKIMNKNKIGHRDLKPPNILVKYKDDDKNKFIIKLCDYGEAKRLTMTKKVFGTKGVGTDYFMAPEILDDQPYDLKCDLWSLGIIIYKLYFKKYPYEGMSTNALLRLINSTGQKILDKSDNKDFDDLIRKLLIKDPKERISWEDYFNHPFFNQKIIIIVKIEKKDIKKDIYFLNDTDSQNIKNEEISNLKKDDYEVFINGIKRESRRFFNPEEEGEYEIKLLFKNKLTNCSSMFSSCENIIKIDLSLFDTSSVTNMHYMFGKCYSLQEVNLTNIQTKNVIDMSYLFNKCKSLKKINFPKSFDTKNVQNMSYMFHYCIQLTDIDFPPSFSTKKVKDMECMFQKCYGIEKLNLGNFETDEVTNIGYMFNECTELKEIIIDPRKFKTDKVIKMGRMFNDCKNLENVNIKNFKYTNAKYLNHMFQNCEKLREIDISELNINKVGININNIFENLTNVKIIVNNESIDKFKEKYKDINFATRKN